MDRNAFLAFALSFLVLSLWMAWEADQRPPPEAPPILAEGEIGAPERDLPPSPQSERRLEPAPPPASEIPPAAETPPEIVKIETDLYEAELTSRGAGIVRWDLRQFEMPRGEGGGPVQLIGGRDPEDLPAFATPLEELRLGNLAYATFHVERLGSTAVAFEYALRGVGIRKTFTFDPDDSYQVRLEIEIDNQSTALLEPRFGVVLPERTREGNDFRELSMVALAEGELERTPLMSFGTPGFFGSAFGSGPELEVVFGSGVDWIGSDARHFLVAMLPDVPRDAQGRWDAVIPGSEALAEVTYRGVSLPSGNRAARSYQLFVGPKEPDRLAAIGPEMTRAVDVGWSWIAPLAHLFNWLLDLCYAVIPNYGVAIIILTIMVRLLTAPLASKQMKSMKRLGELQPKMKELQERYADDRQMQSQEMMKLYKESGVNPLGGCFPMLLQIPVFIGLYYALQSSIALRQAPFMLWIDDLSAPETLFTLPGLELPVRVLPLLMGASMVLQQRMTPTTMDPAQARMMMTVMPVMFTFLFYTFPSGLVLYWFVSNLLAIAQQVLVNRRQTA
ncbi:MAG: membrane protein insertase YidC [Myxococcota bacterium]|nr:membrane protein insertase YidC [Myxococcota bacterium]